MRYLNASLLALPLGSASVDHAFSMEALYYVDVRRALAEVVRVLRPGGTLTVCTDYYEENAACHSWPDDLGIAMELRSEAGWSQLLYEAGFAEVTRWRASDPERPQGSPTLVVHGTNPATV